MAKNTFLELTNRVLRRINQSEITDVSTVSGGSHAHIITNMINEAQNELFTETNWHSLYATRLFTTTTYTASTISFANANPDTIDDSANGFGSFQAVQDVLIAGSTSNDGIYSVETAAAGSLTLQSSDALTVEAEGEAITVTAITYPTATDWGRTIDLVDITNTRVLLEDNMRAIDELYPQMDSTNSPLAYALQGSAYRFHFVPAGEYEIRERYWKSPTALAANADTSDLPQECENCLINYAYFRILEYLNKFDLADRARVEFERTLKRAKIANKRKINQLQVFRSGTWGTRSALTAPQLPPSYGRPWRW